MWLVAWNEIEAKTLRLSWRKIFPLEDESDDEVQQESPVAAPGPSVEEFQSYTKLMLGQDSDQNEIGEWLQTDNSDRGYEHLVSDADIMQNN